jgi:cell division protein FtsI (penicillin-binding protein 3)
MGAYLYLGCVGIALMLGSRVTQPKVRSRPATSAGSGSKATVARPATQRRPKARPHAAGDSKAPVNTAQRPLLVLVVMMLAASGLIARLVYWQVMQHTPLSLDVRRQETALYVQQPMRGEIVDDQGVPLATNVTRDLVWADPQKINNPHLTAADLAPILHVDAGKLENVLVSAGRYVQLAPEVSTATSKQIQNLALPGIFLDPVLQRDYPSNSLASQVLGFVNANGGAAGIEGYYDRILSGQAGVRTILKDTAGNDVRLTAAAAVPSHDGARLQLSIDSDIQALAQHDIDTAIKVHRADSGTILVMNPYTGRIIAMASTPTYNPNNWQQVANTNPSLFKNPSVNQQYEPGSTFKIITMAAGLDRGVITPNTAFDDTGVWPVDGIDLHNWNMAGFGMETMTQVLQHSANVGASFVAKQLGTAAFYSYVSKFLFGRDTGIDVTGEIPGTVLYPGSPGWTLVSLYTNSFGQGIAVTPVQMVRAVSAVANGGILVRPQVVTKITYGGRIITKPPVRLGRVIKASTAHTLTTMLLHSAIGGEASAALIKGYNIAAKTGTANVAGSNGQYISNDTIGSIVAYAPAYHPRFVALVIVNHPRDQPWGSVTAGPVMHDLIQQLILHYHIAPNPHALYK